MIEIPPYTLNRIEFIEGDSDNQNPVGEETKYYYVRAIYSNILRKIGNYGYCRKSNRPNPPSVSLTWHFHVTYPGMNISHFRFLLKVSMPFSRTTNSSYVGWDARVYWVGGNLSSMEFRRFLSVLGFQLEGYDF